MSYVIIIIINNNNIHLIEVSLIFANHEQHTLPSLLLAVVNCKHGSYAVSVRPCQTPNKHLPAC